MSGMPGETVWREGPSNPMSRGAGRGGPPAVLTAKPALPLHLVVQEGGLVEEVAHFAALLILLGGGEEPVLGLLRQELADGRHREHDLLHASVLPHNLIGQATPGHPGQRPSPPPAHARRPLPHLNLRGVVLVVGQRVLLLLLGRRRGLEHLGQLLVVETELGTEVGIGSALQPSRVLLLGVTHQPAQTKATQPEWESVPSSALPWGPATIFQTCPRCKVLLSFLYQGYSTVPQSSCKPHPQILAWLSDPGSLGSRLALDDRSFLPLACPLLLSHSHRSLIPALTSQLCSFTATGPSNPTK